MAIAGIVIGRSPYMSFSQKVRPPLPSPVSSLLIADITPPKQLVQTRVVAQASTLATLIASGALAGMGSQGQKHEVKEDHSWRDILGTSRRPHTPHLTSHYLWSDLADLIVPMHVHRLEQEEREAKQEKQAKKEELENKHTKDVVHHATTQDA